MTDTEAITLLQGLGNEAQDEIDAVSTGFGDFDSSVTNLKNKWDLVSGRLSTMDRSVRYMTDNYGS